MIRYLIIMDINSGVPLFSQSFGFGSDESCENFDGRLNKIPPDLLGSFITALMGFGLQLNYGEVKEIVFQDIHLISKLDENTALVAAVDKGDDIQTIKETMKKVADSFLKLYRDKIANWDGNTDIFQGFTWHLFNEHIINVPPATVRECSHCPDSKYCIPKMVIKKNREHATEKRGPIAGEVS